MLNRRLLKLAVPLAVGALALAACGGKSKNTGSDNTPAPGETSKDKPTYTIGYQGPLSGDYAVLGLNMERGVQLAIKEANDKGDLPFVLKYAPSDDQGDPAQGQTGATKLIDDKSVIAVVGPAFSGATKAAEPAYSEAGLASVSPSATNPDLTNKSVNKFDTFFRVVAADDAQGPAAADYMSKVLNAKKVYSLNDKSEYGVGLAEQIVAQLKANGTEVVDDGLAIGGTYDGVASKIVSSGADVMYYSGYDTDLAKLVKALKAAGYTGKIMSDDGGKSDEYVSQTGSDAEGTLFSCACADALTDPNSASFLDAFKAMHNTDPSTYSSEAYDAANTIIAAMKGLGKADITRAEVVEALKTIEYQGLTGLIKFDEKGDNQVQSIFIYEVKDNKIVVLGKTTELIK